jgi:hypothetical protein
VTDATAGGLRPTRLKSESLRIGASALLNPERMESRGRRTKKARVDVSALEALEQAKSGTAKRANQVQVREVHSSLWFLY